MVEKVKTKEIWPIVYRKEYNVRFFGIENFHPFDSKKWGHIYKVRVMCVDKRPVPCYILPSKPFVNQFYCVAIDVSTKYV